MDHSAVAALIAVDGVVAPAHEATVPALDRGFLYAESVFETCVAFHGTVLHLGAHLARLRRSAAALDAEVPWRDEVLSFELNSLAGRLPCPKVSLRLVVSFGDGLGLTSRDGACRRVIYAFPSPAVPRRLLEKGLILKRCAESFSFQSLVADGPVPKTSNYLSTIVQLRRAVSTGCDDILWTKADGEIREASTANIFFVAREGEGVRLVTPRLESGALRGTTRDTLIELLRRTGIGVSEEAVYCDQIAQFDEAFLCSSVRGLVPIQRIESQRFFTVRTSSVFAQVQRLFFAWVHRELGYAVDWHSGERLSPATTEQQQH